MSRLIVIGVIAWVVTNSARCSVGNDWESPDQAFSHKPASLINSRWSRNTIPAKQLIRRVRRPNDPPAATPAQRACISSIEAAKQEVETSYMAVQAPENANAAFATYKQTIEELDAQRRNAMTSREGPDAAAPRTRFGAVISCSRRIATATSQATTRAYAALARLTCKNTQCHSKILPAQAELAQSQCIESIRRALTALYKVLPAKYPTLRNKYWNKAYDFVVFTVEDAARIEYEKAFENPTVTKLFGIQVVCRAKIGQTVADTFHKIVSDYEVEQVRVNPRSRVKPITFE